MKYLDAEAMFYENYLISDFHTNTVISNRMDLKKYIKKCQKMVLKETQTFRVYNPSSVWREPLTVISRRVCLLLKIQNRDKLYFLSGQGDDSVKFVVDSSALYDTEYKLHDKYLSMASFMSVPGPSRIEHTIKDKCGFFSNATLDSLRVLCLYR